MPVMATIAPFGFEFDIVRFLRANKALGCTTCQFYRNEEAPPSLNEALEAATEGGLPFDSIHGVFGYHIDPSSPDRAHRHECLRIYENEGKLALDLGGPMVVVHPSGWNENRQRLTPAEAESAEAPRRVHLMDFMRRLADVAERLGVVYLIENQPFNCPLGHRPAALAEWVLSVGSARMRMCFDTGHAHISEATRGGAAAALAACAPAVAYIHVHDNDSVEDDHRMPWDGTMDWKGVGGVLKGLAQAPRMLEVFYAEDRVEGLARDGFGTRLRAMLEAG